MNTPLTQSTDPLHKFVWHGYRVTLDVSAIRAGYRRFHGLRYYIDLPEGRFTLYARRGPDGLMQVLTGVYNRTPIYRYVTETTLNDVILYPKGVELGKLDALRRFDESFCYDCQ